MDIDKGFGAMDNCFAPITEVPVTGGHAVLAPEIKTVGRDVKSTMKRYNIHGLTEQDWAAGNQSIGKDSEYTKLPAGLNQKEAGPRAEEINHVMTQLMREQFKDTMVSQERGPNRNGAQLFLKQNGKNGGSKNMQLAYPIDDAENARQRKGRLRGKDGKTF